MKLHVDTRTGVPIYIQLKNQIKHQVATGALRPGDQLPTVRQLAIDLTINPNTVGRVYLELEREGVLATQQGKGTFVAQGPEPGSAGAERRLRLRAMLESSLAAGLSMGFTMEEIRRELEATIAAWKADWTS